MEDTKRWPVIKGIREEKAKVSIYESIIAGLTEAVEDSRIEQKVLKRHTMEIPDDSSFMAKANSLIVPVTATE